MLLELPTADEIDDLAARAPNLTVRRYEFDLVDQKIDLDYTPCKGEAVVVVVKDGGVLLMKTKGTTLWTLPCGRINMHETPEVAATRIVKERCGLAIRSVELKALYDVTRHYQNVSIKRLFIVYSCRTEGDPDASAAGTDVECSIHFGDLDKLALEEMDTQALADSL